MFSLCPHRDGNSPSDLGNGRLGRLPGNRFASEHRLERVKMSLDILVLGGAHIDRRGRIAGDTRMGASNPGAWMEEPGGGAFNAASNLSRLGRKVRLVSPRGGDAQGERVAAAAEHAGIDDCPLVFLDRATPSYTAILENDGNLVIALADMALYDLFVARRLRSRSLRESLDAAGRVLCDANLPAETIATLAAGANHASKPIAAIAISPAKAVRLRAALPRIDHVFMNAAEAEVLAGGRAEDPADWPDLLRRAGLRAGTVTAGGRPTIAFDGKDMAVLAPPAVETIADVTGAGDAFAAGYLHASIAGASLAESLRMGTACAGITLGSFLATDENLSEELLNTRLALVPQAKILS